MRKSEVHDDDISIRNFVPPEVFSRYMRLNEACKSYGEKNIKTQIRFCQNDLEVVDMSEIVDSEKIPALNYNIKWKTK